MTAIFTDISDLKQLQELHRRAERLEAVAALSRVAGARDPEPARLDPELGASSSPAVEARDEDERFLAGLIVRESDRLSRLLSEFLDFARVRATQLGAGRPPRGGVAVVRLIQAHPDCRPDAVAVTVEGGRDRPRGRRGPAAPGRRQPGAQRRAGGARAAGAGHGPRRAAAGQRDCPHGTNLDDAGAAAGPGRRPGHPGRDPGAAVRAVRVGPARRQRARPRHRAARGRGASGPRAASSPGRAPAPPSPSCLPATMHGGGCRMSQKPSVLVVDDESGILDTLRILLRNEGFEVTTAQGGKAGLEQIRDGHPRHRPLRRADAAGLRARHPDRRARAGPDDAGHPHDRAGLAAERHRRR